MPEIEIRIVSSADPAQILDLYRQAGWWQTDDDPRYLDTVAKIVSGTYCFVIAEQGGRIIGMGRAISDGISDAYIQDVTVRKELRGRGIGKAIIRRLVEKLKADGLQWIGLISEPGYEGFYRELGFAVMERYTPFLLKSE
jgi:spermidine synthase